MATGDIRDPEQHFSAVRVRAVREWFANSTSQDERERTKACSRLTAQRQLRFHRRAQEKYVRVRDECKARGDATALAQVVRKLTINIDSLARLEMRIQSDVPKEKWAQRWIKSPIAQPVFMEDMRYDEPQDFGLPADMLIASPGITPSSISLSTDTSTTSVAPHAYMAHEKKIKDNQAQAWTRHERDMSEYFKKICNIEGLWTTRLLYQKRHFENQADNEIYVARAHQSTYTRKTPQSLDFAMHNFWELTSTDTWPFYSNSVSWSIPRLVPIGYVRLLTAPKTWQFLFDFGDGVWTAETNSLPVVASTEVIIYPLVCVYGGKEGKELEVGIQFLESGCLKVMFPAIWLWKDDPEITLHRCTAEKGAMIEFSGTSWGDDK